MKPHVLFLLAVLLLAPLFPGCQSMPEQPEAKAFATLQLAAAGIDAYRATYEAAFASGQITAVQKAEADHRFNRANDAIIAAARVLRDVGGMQAGTPAEVDAAVQALADLVITLVPPKTQKTS